MDRPCMDMAATYQSPLLLFAHYHAFLWLTHMHKSCFDFIQRTVIVELLGGGDSLFFMKAQVQDTSEAENEMHLG